MSYYEFSRCTCWINKRPILNKAHDAATNKGAAITNKRVSINNYPYVILKNRKSNILL